MSNLFSPGRILVVDDAPVVREALRWVIEDTPDLEMVGDAGEGREALARAAKLMPDVVVLDIHLPNLDGYDVARVLKSMPNPPAVVFLSVDSDTEAEQRGVKAGGDAFVPKAQGWDALLTQIRAVLMARAKGKEQAE
ncbi:MAG TPA: response regulator transcription factor [Anaerolineales bacterium]|nr:response regulator transcription factor [Anaerolineales bacterium]